MVHNSAFSALIVFFLAATLYGQSSSPARDAHELIGHLEPTLNAGTIRFQGDLLVTAPAADRAAIPLPLTANDHVFIGVAILPIKLALIEQVNGNSILFADINRNGSFESK